jgi:hypothetical protein
MRDRYRVVLSLRDLKPDEEKAAEAAHFVHLRYADLIASARGLLGLYAARANLKFLSYFTDFMQTIDNLTGPQTESKLDEFFLKHGSKMEELSQNYLNFRNGRIPAVLTLINRKLMDRIQKALFRQGIWQKTCLGTQLRAMGDHTAKAISVDLVFSPVQEIWYIRIFSRNFDNNSIDPDFFRVLIPAFQEKLGSGYHLRSTPDFLREFPFNTTIDEVASNLEEALRKVLQVLGYDLNTVLKAPNSLESSQKS